MPVAAVALLESAYPIGVTGTFLGASMRASSVIVSSVLRIRDIGNEEGA
jgi:hypothetical protein